MRQGSIGEGLGTLLVESGVTSVDAVRFATQEQQITGETLGEVLERNGFIGQSDLARYTAQLFDLEVVDTATTEPQPEALRCFNLNICTTYQFLPLRISGEQIEVAYTGTDDDLDGLSDLIYRHSGYLALIRIGEREKIRHAIEFHYQFLDNPIEQIVEKEIARISADLESPRNLDGLLTNMFRLAVKRRATDIHIRSMQRSINVSFRVDGILQPVFCLRPELKRLIATVKTRAGMDIAERRLPQDGAFPLELKSRQFDVRVSSTVGIHGENLVLRLLAKESVSFGFEELGFLAEDLQKLRELFRIPYGMVLMTGPTGSGKTTSLYAGIRSQDVLSKNILTVEDPIEYQVSVIRQTQVNEKAGYTFANAIRHFLRHDPDIILVGEIRDRETAETAISAAETGHLVLSTLHTNNAMGVISRMGALGISRSLLAGSLAGIVAQRLIRTLCPHCKTAYQPNDDELTFLQLQQSRTLFRANGCERCDNNGYRGREPIYEILRVDHQLAVAIGAEAEQLELVDIARRGGFEEMLDTARKKVFAGRTSVNEIRRVLWSR